MSLEAISEARKLKLPPRDKFVLIALADYANDDGEAWPKQSTLCEWTCYDRSTVNAALASLEKAGVITSRQLYRDDGGKSVKRYHLAFLATTTPHVAEADIPHVGESDMGMSAAPTSPCSPRQQPHVGTANSKNPQKEPPVKNHQKREREKPAKPAKKFDPLEVELPAFVDPQAWADFVGHRSEIRKPLTQRAARLILADLEKHPADANEMLATSVKRGWTGVFPLDKPRNAPKASPKLATADDFKAEVTADDLLQPGRL